MRRLPREAFDERSAKLPVTNAKFLSHTEWLRAAGLDLLYCWTILTCYAKSRQDDKSECTAYTSIALQAIHSHAQKRSFLLTTH